MGRRKYSHRLTVEECRVISVFSLNKHQYFSGKIYFGAASWSHMGRKTGHLDLMISMSPGEENICFQHTYPCPFTGLSLSIEYQVKLLSSPCYFGGHRWWFACPVKEYGITCTRRVGVLYLPPRVKYFGCRHCYNLTYNSCKDNHRFDSICKRIGCTVKDFNSLRKVY